MIERIVLDRKNYDESLDILTRVAIRSIVIKDGKLLLLVDKNGRLNFPGGGQELGETDIDTLVRETQEETGYIVLQDTISDFFEVVEKRMASKEPMIWHQINRYYFCDVDEIQNTCHYTDHEKELDLHIVWLEIGEAISRIVQNFSDQENEKVFGREYNLLLHVKEYLKM